MNNVLFRLAQSIDTSHLPGANGGGVTSEASIAIIKNFVFGVFGITAVLIITLAGFQYVISQGDPQKVAKAKDTIIYAVIGLVVTILAYSIVSFVLGRVN